MSVRKWFRKFFYRTCRVCGTEFRKHKVQLPSLVGYAYCSLICEHKAWDEWIKS